MGTYPEHDKLEQVQDKAQVIGEFLDWLTNEQEISLCSANSQTPDRMYVVHDSIQDWIASFFGIDTARLEAEKRAMIKSLNAQPLV